MKRFIALVVVLAGCASSGEYVSRPAPVLPPPDAPVAAAPGSAPAGYPANAPPLCVESRSRFSERFSRWFASGRGWTWGAASCGPVRDQELDRLMVDTLTSSRPDYSREPATPRPRPIDAPWIYPSQGSNPPPQASP
jgi:hypothetical protein